MKNILLAFVFSVAFVNAQNVSCLLSGTVHDPTKAVVVGAEVKLTADATGFVRATKTNSEGFFSFPSLAPSIYTLTISAPGFKSHSQAGIEINSGEERSVGIVSLQVGATTETITVTAEAATVMTASGERAGVLTADDLSDVAIRSRDFMDAIALIPGVVDLNETREAPSFDSINGVHILGGRNSAKNMTVDGVTNLDNGSATAVTTMPSMDSVAELKVLMSNYAAEHGRNSGGTITVITKGGGKNFHFTGGWYHRHESFAANNYFNNRNSLGRSPYRYNIFSYTVGGPIYIPNAFNKDRSRLFFFFSQEFQEQRVSVASKTVTVPTELERAGDFSKTYDVNGKLKTIYDPQDGKRPFPGNVIPLARVSPIGRNVLDLFPLPNFIDPTPSRQYNWNYISNPSYPNPRRTEIVRIDYSPRQNAQFYVRLSNNKDESSAYYGSWPTGSLNFPLTPITLRQPGRGGALHSTVVVSPKVFNDLTFGVSQNFINWFPADPERVSRKATGIDIPQWYPQNNLTGYIPQMTFGGVSNYANPYLSNTAPAYTYTTNFNLIENVSMIHGTHTFKAGIYVERSRKDNRGSQNSYIRGAVAFDADSSNPLDSNYAYSNALIGTYKSYTESTGQPQSQFRFTNLEWYVQDDWRVKPGVFINYGVRFYGNPPPYDARSLLATFVPEYFDPSKAPVLLRPGYDSKKIKVAIDPLSGAEYAAIMVGAFVPGVGDPGNGTAIGGKNGFPRGLYSTSAVSVAPRLGFAWDPFGKGRTVVRGGGGVYYNRCPLNPINAMVNNPPIVYTSMLYYGTLESLAATAGQAVMAPTGSVDSMYGAQKPERVYNFSFGLQQQIGRRLAVDVSYVGSLGRFLWSKQNINAVPVGARFLDLHPENRDPTTSSSALSPNFLRPYQGWGDIYLYRFGNTSNYNSLQVSATYRARQNTVTLGYSFSKALGVAQAESAAISPFFDPRTRNYGPLTYDRTHVLTLRYNYRLPEPGRRLQWRWMGVITDHWEIAGVTRIMSGGPFTPGLTTVDGQDIPGTPSESARPDVIRPDADAVDRFGRPARGTFGNTGSNVLRGPGMNNWDLSIYRRIPIREGGKEVQLRVESYNTANHTQFSAVSQSTKFDLQGNQVDSMFLQPTAARNPRRIQVALRLHW